MNKTPLAALSIGDVVQLYDGAFGTGIVVSESETEIKIRRPYGTISDDIYGGGDEAYAIFYTGVEEVVYRRDIDSGRMFNRLRRGKSYDEEAGS